MESNNKKISKIVLIIIAVMLIITGGYTWWYLGTRDNVPENSIEVSVNGKKEYVDIDKLDLSEINGSVVNGKGETKEVAGRGIHLADVISVADYSEVIVTSDDEFSATVKKEELGNAWLMISDKKATLYVFDDENSKRNVKNVVRIEVK